MGKHTSTQKAGPKSSHEGTANTRTQREGRGMRTTGNHAGKKARRASQSAAAGFLRNRTPTPTTATMIAAFDRQIAADYPDMTDAEIAAAAAAAAAAIATKRGGKRRRRRSTRTKRSKRSGSKRGGSRCSSRRVRRR
jgi:hypothetical protein